MQVYSIIKQVSLIGYQVVLNRVNTYLQKIPQWEQWVNRSRGLLSSPGLCSLSITDQNISIMYTPRSVGAIELQACKTISYTKGVSFDTTLTDLVNELGLKNTRCSWVLDPKYYQLLLVDDLPVKPDEFQSAIRWKIKGLIPFAIEDAIIDKFPMPIQKAQNSQAMIMVVVSRASVLQKTTELIMNSGLKLNTIDIEELSLRNITAMFETDESSSALIYFKKNQGNLIITNQKQLYLSRKIDFDLDSLKADAVDINQQVEKLALVIQRSLDYYQSQWRVPAPSRILIASSKSGVGQLIENLSSHLAATVKMLNLNEIIYNKANLSLEQQYNLLPLIGSLLRDEIILHAEH